MKSKYNGKLIKIKYSVDVRTDDYRWWLNANSQLAKQIRVELGLSSIPYFGYHITVGRADGDLRLEHSKYIHNLIKKCGELYH